MSDISVEVCYALPDKQFLIPVKINEGATVEAVILASGILALRDDCLLYTSDAADERG